MKIYFNLELNKNRAKFAKENKKKAGIYMWTNLINNKNYIGSSINISARIYKYFNKKILIENKTIIIKAINKYNYNNFKLTILEYCSPDIVLEREQYYIDTYNPIYNICKIAGSTLGYFHKEETKLKISKALGMPTTVVDILKNKSYIFNSIVKASHFLNVNNTTVRNYIKSKKLYRNRYVISVIKT